LLSIKDRNLGNFIAMLMALLILAVPILAQQAENAALLAQEQARRDVNATTWFIIGFFLGIVGYALAYLIVPNPPSSALVGKSPEYVAIYSDAYREEGKRIQTSKALIGCLVNTGIWVALYAFVIAAAATTTATYYY